MVDAPGLQVVHPSVRAMVITGTGRDFCTGAEAAASNEAIAETTTLAFRFKTADFNQLALLTTTADRLEGVRGFVEGRPPEFTGA